MLPGRCEVCGHFTEGRFRHRPASRLRRWWQGRMDAGWRWACEEHLFLLYQPKERP